MRTIAYFDPYDAEAENRCVFSTPQQIDERITHYMAIKLWDTVMRKAVDKDDPSNVLLRPSNTTSMAFARKIQEFMSDEYHIYNKFENIPPKASDIYQAAKFSSSKWGRIMSGELLDIERGNAFAIAVALRLDTKQTEELLYSAGLAINYELDLDAAMMFFIKKEIYDLDYIYSVLKCFSNIKNGLDCFIFQPRTDKQMPV
jgi:hypothetical protein